MKVPAGALREVTQADVDRIDEVIYGRRVISPNDSYELLVALTRELLELRQLVEGIAAMTGYVRVWDHAETAHPGRIVL